MPDAMKVKNELHLFCRNLGSRPVVCSVCVCVVCVCVCVCGPIVRLFPLHIQAFWKFLLQKRLPSNSLSTMEFGEFSVCVCLWCGVYVCARAYVYGQVNVVRYVIW